MSYKTSQKARHQRGLTLAETLLVLAIGTVAIVGGTILYLQASGAQRINETVNNLNALQGQIAGLYTTQPGYGSAEFSNQLIQAGIVPVSMVVGSGAAATMRNAWGGAVEVHPTNGGSGYRISYDNIPRDACVSLLTKLAGGGQSSLLGFSVGSGAAPTGGNPVQSPPVSIADALQTCAHNSSNGVSFYYR
ncbi:MAG: type 4a pilus major pilin PilS [Alphaproteobacteria bacterium]